MEEGKSFGFGGPAYRVCGVPNSGKHGKLRQTFAGVAGQCL